MPQIIYKIKETGEAINLRFTPDDYVLKEGEILFKRGGSMLPDIESLHLHSFLDSRTAKAQQQIDRDVELADALPTWASIEGAVDAITNLAEAKVFLKKLARVLYLHIKNSGV